MLVNLPVWGYYPKDNSKFVDPLYIPYQDTWMKTKSGETCPVNTWEVQGYADGFVNPALVRKGWGLTFQLQHPDKDPCPEGWSKINGMCVENEPEYGGQDAGLYSVNSFTPKYQYWDSYTQRNQNAFVREINEFDNRSINPFTGDMVSYMTSYPSSSTTRYGKLRSKDSLIA